MIIGGYSPGGMSPTSDTSVRQTVAESHTMKNAKNGLIIQDSLSYLLKRSCSYTEVSPIEKGSLTEPNNLCLTSASITMKNTKCPQKEDRSCFETVEKKFLETYGDTISDEMCGPISR
jgi:hypothetical protein